MDTATTKPPIINCHTHIFTGDCVPPWLAKTIIPAPFHYLLPVSLFVTIVRWWYNGPWSPYLLQFHGRYKKVARVLYVVKISMIRYFLLRIIKFIAGAIFLLSVFHDQYAGLILPKIEKQVWLTVRLDWLDQKLVATQVLIITDKIWLKLALLIVFLLFFPSGRNLLWWLAKQSFSFLKMLPGKQTTEILKRYWNIVRFARYKNQSGILTRLTNQYPPDSSVVVLPMDMEFMGAGTQRKPFQLQMQELAELKEKRPGKIFPFLFIDPRREKAGDKIFFDYDVSNGEVILKDCFVKEYMESKNFSGLKIYPALGYYPFEEKLLPLWKYAADHGIPIMTHCIRGVIYYRGIKEKAWDFHPLFEQAMGKEDDEDGEEESTYAPLLLPQMKSLEYQQNFTHPLNFACLLKKEWLAQLVGRSKDARIKTLFGYNEDDHTISRDLNHLKICFGHFGGDDEWLRFFEKDRDNYASQLVKNPDNGIDFLGNGKSIKRGKQEQIWKYVDWYTIICSLMLQHDNVYADISYILHSTQNVLPLLKHTLQHETLKKRVLYGTDFYVVRNHKSDKNMLADMMGGLSEEEFDQIARINPLGYLAKTQVQPSTVEMVLTAVAASKPE